MKTMETKNGLKNRVYTCVTCLFREVDFGDRVLRNDLKKDFFMCGALLSPHGFKNDLYFIVVRLCRPWLKERGIFHV